MRGHRRRKVRPSAAYFLTGAAFGFDFFFEAGTISLAAGFGVPCGPFVLVFFGMMLSCLGPATGNIDDRRKVNGWQAAFKIDGYGDAAHRQGKERAVAGGCPAGKSLPGTSPSCYDHTIITGRQYKGLRRFFLKP